MLMMVRVTLLTVALAAALESTSAFTPSTTLPIIKHKSTSMMHLVPERDARKLVAFSEYYLSQKSKKGGKGSSNIASRTTDAARFAAVRGFFSNLVGYEEKHKGTSEEHRFLEDEDDAVGHAVGATTFSLSP